MEDIHSALSLRVYLCVCPCVCVCVCVCVFASQSPADPSMISRLSEENTRPLEKLLITLSCLHTFSPSPLSLPKGTRVVRSRRHGVPQGYPSDGGTAVDEPCPLLVFAEAQGGSVGGDRRRGPGGAPGLASGGGATRRLNPYGGYGGSGGGGASVGSYRYTKSSWSRLSSAVETIRRVGRMLRGASLRMYRQVRQAVPALFSGLAVVRWVLSPRGGVGRTTAPLGCCGEDGDIVGAFANITMMMRPTASSSSSGIGGSGSIGSKDVVLSRHAELLLFEHRAKSFKAFSSYAVSLLRDLESSLLVLKKLGDSQVYAHSSLSLRDSPLDSRIGPLALELSRLEAKLHRTPHRNSAAEFAAAGGAGAAGGGAALGGAHAPSSSDPYYSTAGGQLRQTTTNNGGGGTPLARKPERGAREERPAAVEGDSSVRIQEITVDLTVMALCTLRALLAWLHLAKISDPGGLIAKSSTPVDLVKHTVNIESMAQDLLARCSGMLEPVAVEYLEHLLAVSSDATYTVMRRFADQLAKHDLPRNVAETLKRVVDRVAS
eukprot:GHVU01215804.1.p1 GENE.GHVU01215804.1~~GHVU01215804.1.p1  ORF type:complete len:546 (-),score=97.09 GHVU01215804.1:312-1949(-)